MKYKYRKKGFTITELLVGLSIGIVVLTGLMSFYFRSSKMIGDQQTMVKDLSQFQFVMNKIVQDIKESNSEAPGTGSTIDGTQWSNLPFLCYIRTFNSISIDQPPDTSYPKEFPSYPVAFLFPWQSGKAGLPDGWFPKENPVTPIPPAPEKESNQLIFYKVLNNQVIRVVYYIEQDPVYPITSNVYRLRRKQQLGILPTSIALNDPTLSTSDTVILSGLNYVQFTYPVLTKKLTQSGDLEYNSTQADLNLRAQVTGVPTTDPGKVPYLQSQVMNKYRNIIKIKIATTGPQIGNRRVNALELSTEVNVRN